MSHLIPTTDSPQLKFTSTPTAQSTGIDCDTVSNPSTATRDTLALDMDDNDKEGPKTATPALSARPSQTTLAADAALPPGCSYGELPPVDGGAAERVIWVDFPAGSTDNPFYFSRNRKVGITLVAIVYTFVSAFTTSAYAISTDSMVRSIPMNTREMEAGLALYAYGFGVFPLFLAPLSEEFGRKWTYVGACVCYWLMHLPLALAKNVETVLISRFLIGGAGSIGATLVGGTISDIYIPAHRGIPMSLFGFCAVFGTGLGGALMSFVEATVGWRWVWWSQFIFMGIFTPIVVVVMRETRAPVILRRRAAKLRRERGMSDGARYLAHSEVDKVKFMTAMRHSLLRPLIFLVKEPIVTFFSLWIALGWGVFYSQISGLPYIYKRLHNFSIIGVGQVYWTICLGAAIGLFANFFQERVYRARAAKHGVEARLYAPMVAGILFAAGCFITGFTALPSVHWIGPCFGITILLAAIMTIYITSFTYLSECYGKYASSAIAGQSFARNMFGGSFTFFTTIMFDAITVRWGLVLMGGVAALLALVPFVAFFYGPQIRARSPYSRELMALEKEDIENERYQREALGMDVRDMEDLEGDVNESSAAGYQHGAQGGHRGGEKV